MNAPIEYFELKPLAKEVRYTVHGGKGGGIGSIVAVAAAIAIPIAAPAIAGAIGASSAITTALAGVGFSGAVASTAGVAIASGLTGAALGALKAAAFDEDIGRGALTGGLTGGLAGVLNPTGEIGFLGVEGTPVVNNVTGEVLIPTTSSAAVASGGAELGEATQFGQGALPDTATAAGGAEGSFIDTVGVQGPQAGGLNLSGGTGVPSTSAIPNTATAAGGGQGSFVDAVSLPSAPPPGTVNFPGYENFAAGAGRAATPPGAPVVKPESFFDKLKQAVSNRAAETFSPDNFVDNAINTAGQLGTRAIVEGAYGTEDALLESQIDNLNQIRAREDRLLAKREAIADRAVGEANQISPLARAQDEANRAKIGASRATDAAVRAQGRADPYSQLAQRSIQRKGDIEAQRLESGGFSRGFSKGQASRRDAVTTAAGLYPAGAGGQAISSGSSVLGDTSKLNQDKRDEAETFAKLVGFGYPDTFSSGRDA